MVSSRRSFIKCAVGAGASASVLASARTGSGAQAQPGGVRGFDHVALPMQNVEAMLAFYRRLGFQVNEGAQSCSAHFGAQMINFHRPSLWQNATSALRAPAARPPCGDLCFVWDGSPDSLKAMLEKAGAGVITGPVGRVGGRQTTGSSVYVRDPDENLLEFIIYS